MEQNELDILYDTDINQVYEEFFFASLNNNETIEDVVKDLECGEGNDNNRHSRKAAEYIAGFYRNYCKDNNRYDLV